MKAIIELDVPDYQIGQKVSIYFKDTMMIKAIVQEPCVDVVSKQAVLDINESHHGQMPNHINYQIWQEIKDLPPVTPQPKTGHWLRTGEVDVFYDLPSYECSKCGQTSLENGDYCPNCGAKMQEVEV